MYTKVWFPRIRYAYNKCIPNVYQGMFDIPRIRYAYPNVYQSLIS